MKIPAKNHYRSFTIKLAAFIALVFVLDLVIGHFLQTLYFKQDSGYDFQTTYSIEETKADLVVFGSSRAVNIFNADIFEKETGMSCYNAGRYGEPIFYHYAVLKGVLKRYKPRMVILSFDAGNFSVNQEAYDRLTALMPYYKEHPEIRSLIALKGPYEKLKLASKIYPYNSLIIPMITGNTEYSKKKYPHTKGFIPIHRTFSGPLKKVDYTKETVLDTVKIDTYRAFIRDCKDAGIELHIVCPPYMIDATGTDASIILGKRIAMENNINFLDYTKDSVYTSKPALFADFRHLNATGVQLFSNDVIKRIGAHR